MLLFENKAFADGSKRQNEVILGYGGPKINDGHLSKEEGGTHSNHKEAGHGEDGGRNWSNAAMSQGFMEPSEGRKRQGAFFSFEPQREQGLADLTKL